MPKATVTIELNSYELSLVNIALAYYEFNSEAARALINKIDGQVSAQINVTP